MKHEHEHWDVPPMEVPRRDETPESLLENPGDEEAYQAHFESICGSKDESQAVELYDGSFEVSKAFVDTHQRAVGQLRWNDDIDDFEGSYVDLDQFAGQRECTGTLIDDDLFLTAGHCLVVHGGPRPVDVARSMHVEFNYQLDPDRTLREVQPYRVLDIVEYEFCLNGMDYAILRLDRAPGSEFGTVGIASTDAMTGDTLCIISHPNGMPKRVDAGHATHLHDVRIGYGDIDTAGGSSGAGILDKRGKLVGVHTQPGCDRIRGGHNHGIRVGSLLSVSPTLRALASQEGGSTSQCTPHGGSGHSHAGDAGHSLPTGLWPLESSRSRLESHRSSLESHRSSLESHRSSLESHRSSLESHRSSLESHRSSLESHRSTLESHEAALNQTTRSLDALRDAIYTLTEELGGVDTSPVQTANEDESTTE